ncbi:uncharacterized protein LOC123303207 [Chrysoperla carnea]|uniref:uncharacterized protein LOC123303207 n=1 Tax=Chrysoperla carnea TaxID=189513 RepID=UPI001D069724|nr:uncharacterized protein LOC123303207 [Chrysoperla carnea]
MSQRIVLLFFVIMSMYCTCLSKPSRRKFEYPKQCTAYYSNSKRHTSALKECLIKECGVRTNEEYSDKNGLTRCQLCGNDGKLRSVCQETPIIGCKCKAGYCRHPATGSCVSESSQ